jgi:hypothetical protein
MRPRATESVAGIEKIWVLSLLSICKCKTKVVFNHSLTSKVQNRPSWNSEEVWWVEPHRAKMRKPTVNESSKWKC